MAVFDRWIPRDDQWDRMPVRFELTGVQKDDRPQADALIEDHPPISSWPTLVAAHRLRSARSSGGGARLWFLPRCSPDLEVNQPSQRSCIGCAWHQRKRNLAGEQNPRLDNPVGRNVTIILKSGICFGSGLNALKGKIPVSEQFVRPTRRSAGRDFDRHQQYPSHRCAPSMSTVRYRACDESGS